MRVIHKKILFSVLPGILVAAPAMAADATSGDANKDNTTLYALVGLMLVLLFVIGALGHTLIQLVAVAREKMRKDRASTAGKAGMLLLLLFLISGRSLAAEAVSSPAVEMIDGLPATEFYVLVSAIIIELMTVFALVIFIRVLIRIIKGVPDVPAIAKEKKSWFWQDLNKAVAVEKEGEILLDHNYDGIQELDNSLPPWWKYGFYLTIVVSIIYLYRFHMSHDGLSQLEEFTAEMHQGEEEKAAYLASSANNVDESNVTLLTDGVAIAAGQELFVKNCAACHLPDGGGSVGPNLTDEYWLHGGSLKDVFKSIKYGWQDKGMKSWKDDLSPSQIQQVASFIGSLKGSRPATPKAPQGGLYVELKSPAVDAMQDTLANGK